MRTIAAILVSLASIAVLIGCTAGGSPVGTQQTASRQMSSRQALAKEALSVKGSLPYRARVALPPETRAVVELKDASGARGPVVAEQRMDLQGRQVPVAFELAVDPAKLVEGRPYSVRAAFSLHGRPTWVSDPVVITPQRDLIDVGVLEMKPYTALAFASDLRCGDQRVTIGYVGNAMRLTVGDQSFDMRPVASASGSKYEAVGDPSTTLWIKDTAATVAIKGVAYPPCTKVSAGERAPLRATGNEPGWRLDIGDAEMVFVANHGQGQTRIVAPTPGEDGRVAQIRHEERRQGSHVPFISHTTLSRRHAAHDDVSETAAAASSRV